MDGCGWVSQPKLAKKRALGGRVLVQTDTGVSLYSKGGSAADPYRSVLPMKDK